MIRKFFLKKDGMNETIKKRMKKKTEKKKVGGKKKEI